MASIQPVNNELNELIKSDTYRSIVNKISEKYNVMDGFINNLTSDINEIANLVDQLARDTQQGYNTGTSADTLNFQKDTLSLDRDFFSKQKNTYLKKIYKDLYKYTSEIIARCVEIENNPANTPKEDLVKSKFAGSRQYTEEDDENEDGIPFTMSDVFSLLSVTERNLYELASDIATFQDRIANAESKEKRGFAIGNLVLNLKEQQSRLVFSFKSYCSRLEMFLNENYKFSGKCVKRIELISGEIVTQEELDEQAAAAAAAGDGGGGDGGDGGGGDGGGDGGGSGGGDGGAGNGGN